MHSVRFCEHCGRPLGKGPWSVKAYSGFSGEPIRWERRLVCPVQLGLLGLLFPFVTRSHTDAVEISDTRPSDG